jgi:hypothetical protein
MAERNEQVLARVRAALQKNPDVASRELFENIKSNDPQLVEGESLRSFHARYVLSLKREGRKGGRKSAAKKGGRKGASKSATKSARGTAAAVGKSTRAAYGSRGGKRQREAEARRTQVRQVFLQFAREVAGAESPTDIVDVIGNVDKFVDQVLG